MDKMVRKILNVDDNEKGRYLITRQLRHAGFEVIEAATGEEALRKLSEGPDVVLLDVKLPDINGFEVCRRIKENPATASTTVIHLSAHVTDTAYKVRGLEAGADAYLTEPIEAQELVATIRSMIRLREAEESVRKLNAELNLKVTELEQQRAFQERFASTLSHDLRNPLAAARSLSQLLQRQLPAEDPRRGKVDRIIKNLDRGNDMISNLLDASRIRAGVRPPLDLAPCNLRAMAAETVEELQLIHGDRFRLLAPESCEGVWSCQAMRRVLDNLLSNALKYGASETPVVVRIQPGVDSVSLSVTNFGNVIPESEIASLFDAYRRSVSAQENGNPGWGLGLTLVKGIVQAHGGSVQVASSKEDGTTFTVTLPLDSTPYQPLESAREA